MTRIGQPLPVPPPEYDANHEEIMRRQIEQNFEDAFSDDEKDRTYVSSVSSLALRRYLFLGSPTSVLSPGDSVDVSGTGTANTLVKWLDADTLTDATSLVHTTDLLEMHRTTNPQEFRLYGTRTDASNYERLSIRYEAGGGDFGDDWYLIQIQNAGTGSARGMQMGPPSGSSQDFYLTGEVFCEFSFATGDGGFTATRNTVGTHTVLGGTNNNTGAAANCRTFIQNASTGGGDPYNTWVNNLTNFYSAGIDQTTGLFHFYNASGGLDRPRDTSGLGWTLDGSGHVVMLGDLNVVGTLTAGTYTGQTSIVTLGTITAGVWTGTSISTTFTDAKVVSVAVGAGLDITEASPNPSISVDFFELSVVTAVAADWLTVVDATDSSTKRALISATGLHHFDNSTSNFSTTTGTVTSVGSGDGLSGGPITGSGTLTVDATVLRTTGAQSKAGILTLTSQLLADFGLVATPGVGFDGDPDNGMYRVTTNQIGLVTGGVRRIHVVHVDANEGQVIIEDAQLRTQEFDQSVTLDEIDWDEGNCCVMANSTASGARVLTNVAQLEGASYKIIIEAAAGATANWTWTGFEFPGGNPAGEPTLTTTSGRQDIIDLLYTNGTMKATFVLDFS